MFVLDGPGSVENQSASGAESAEGLPLEGHLVIQLFCVCVCDLYVMKFSCICSFTLPVNALWYLLFCHHRCKMKVLHILNSETKLIFFLTL